MVPVEKSNNFAITFRERREMYKANCYVGESGGFHTRHSKPGDASQEDVFALLASDNKRSSML